MRHFTIIFAVGSAERMGAGGTMQEAKHQAAGAVLEEISSPTENINDTKQQDHEEMIQMKMTRPINPMKTVQSLASLMISTVLRISNKLK